MTHDQIATAAAALASGKSQNEAAALVNVPRSTMRYNLERDDVQNIVKQGQLQLISDALQNAIQNQVDKIKTSGTLISTFSQGKNLPDGYKTYAELGARAEEKLLESVGIHTAHTQSIQVNNILVDARSEMSPTVEALLSKHLQVEDDVVDV